MIRYVVRAVLTLAVSALVGSFVVFVLLQGLGGDAATIILGKDATAESLAALRAELGLDRPWLVRYVEWLGDLVVGDLGTSYAARYDIAYEIASRISVTVTLAVSSLLLSCLLGLVLGTFAAVNSRKLRGTVVDVLAQLGMAVPAFWGGMLLILLFAVQLGWLPAGGTVSWAEDPVAAWISMVLPVAALSVRLTAVLTRFVRSAMLDVLGEDYIRTAMAKGMTRRWSAIRHGVRNAAVPLVTVATLQLGELLSGAVVIENVFQLPGLGRMLVVAVADREAIVVQSLVFVVILLILVINFWMDMAYGLLDPRIRDAEGRAARV